jgi:hypothetical protein
MIGFNYTSNGFVTDENNINIIRMTGDAKLRIQLPLFNYDYIDSNNQKVTLGSLLDNGRTAEFRFKVSNVTNSNTTIIDFFTETDRVEKIPNQVGASITGSGFRVQPNLAFIMNGTLAYDYDDNVKYPQQLAVTHFSDNEIIRLSFVVEGAGQSGNGKQALKIYLNGELARVYPFSTISGPMFIELGSPDCVMDLYSAVFYKNGLTENEIIVNYLADNPSVRERIDNYKFNDVKASDNATRGDIYLNFDGMLNYAECIKRVPCILTVG